MIFRNDPDVVRYLESEEYLKEQRVKARHHVRPMYTLHTDAESCCQLTPPYAWDGISNDPDIGRYDKYATKCQFGGSGPGFMASLPEPSEKILNKWVTEGGSCFYGDPLYMKCLQIHSKYAEISGWWRRGNTLLEDENCTSTIPVQGKRPNITDSYFSEDV